MSDFTSSSYFAQPKRVPISKHKVVVHDPSRRPQVYHERVHVWSTSSATPKSQKRKFGSPRSNRSRSPKAISPSVRSELLLPSLKSRKDRSPRQFSRTMPNGTRSLRKSDFSTPQTTSPSHTPSRFASSDRKRIGLVNSSEFQGGFAPEPPSTAPSRLKRPARYSRFSSRSSPSPPSSSASASFHRKDLFSSSRKSVHNHDDDEIEIEAIRHHALDDRVRVRRYLQSEQCQLFCEVDEVRAYSSDMDKIIEAGTNVRRALQWLRRLDREQERFSTVPELIEALRKLHANCFKATSEEREQLLFYLTGPSCCLFSAVPSGTSLTAYPVDLDDLIHIGGSAEHTIQLLQQMSERGDKFMNLDQLLPALKDAVYEEGIRKRQLALRKLQLESQRKALCDYLQRDKCELFGDIVSMVIRKGNLDEIINASDGMLADALFFLHQLNQKVIESGRPYSEISALVRDVSAQCKVARLCKNQICQRYGSHCPLFESSDTKLTLPIVDRIYRESGAGSESLNHMEEMEALGRTCEDLEHLILEIRNAHVRHIAKRKRQRARQVLLGFLCDPTCHLLQPNLIDEDHVAKSRGINDPSTTASNSDMLDQQAQRPEKMLPTNQQLDTILRTAGSVALALLYMEHMHIEGRVFGSVEEVVAALEQNARDAVEQKKEILAFLRDPNLCQLFPTYVNEIDQSLDQEQEDENVSPSSSFGSSSRVPAAVVPDMSIFHKTLEAHSEDNDSQEPSNDDRNKQQEEIFEEFDQNLDNGESKKETSEQNEATRRDSSGADNNTPTTSIKQNIILKADVERLYVRAGTGPKTMYLLKQINARGHVFASPIELIPVLKDTFQTALNALAIEHDILRVYLTSHLNLFYCCRSLPLWDNRSMHQLLPLNRSSIDTLLLLNQLSRTRRKFFSFQHLLDTLNQLRTTTRESDGGFQWFSEQIKSFISSNHCRIFRSSVNLDAVYSGLADMIRPKSLESASHQNSDSNTNDTTDEHLSLFDYGTSSGELLVYLWMANLCASKFSSAQQFFNSVRDYFTQSMLQSVTHQQQLLQTVYFAQISRLFNGIGGAADGSNADKTAISNMGPLSARKLDELEACGGGLISTVQYMISLEKDKYVFASWQELVEAVETLANQANRDKDEALGLLTSPKCQVFSVAPNGMAPALMVGNAESMLKKRRARMIAGLQTSDIDQLFYWPSNRIHQLQSSPALPERKENSSSSSSTVSSSASNFSYDWNLQFKLPRAHSLIEDHSFTRSYILDLLHRLDNRASKLGSFQELLATISTRRLQLHECALQFQAILYCILNRPSCLLLPTPSHPQPFYHNHLHHSISPVLLNTSSVREAKPVLSPNVYTHITNEELMQIIDFADQSGPVAVYHLIALRSQNVRFDNMPQVAAAVRRQVEESYQDARQQVLMYLQGKHWTGPCTLFRTGVIANELLDMTLVDQLFDFSIWGTTRPGFQVLVELLMLDANCQPSRFESIDQLLSTLRKTSPLQSLKALFLGDCELASSLSQSSQPSPDASSSTFNDSPISMMVIRTVFSYLISPHCKLFKRKEVLPGENDEDNKPSSSTQEDQPINDSNALGLIDEELKWIDQELKNDDPRNHQDHFVREDSTVIKQSPISSSSSQHRPCFRLSYDQIQQMIHSAGNSSWRLISIFESFQQEEVVFLGSHQLAEAVAERYAQQITKLRQLLLGHLQENTNLFALPFQSPIENIKLAVDRLEMVFAGESSLVYMQEIVETHSTNQESPKDGNNDTAHASGFGEAFSLDQLIDFVQSYHYIAEGREPSQLSEEVLLSSSSSSSALSSSSSSLASESFLKYTESRGFVVIARVTDLEKTVSKARLSNPDCLKQDVWKLLDYMTGPSCKLFSQPISIKETDLEHMLLSRDDGDVNRLIEDLKELQQEACQFATTDELLSLTDLRLEQTRHDKKQIRDFLTSEDLRLFVPTFLASSTKKSRPTRKLKHRHQAMRPVVVKDTDIDVIYLVGGGYHRIRELVRAEEKNNSSSEQLSSSSPSSSFLLLCDDSRPLLHLKRLNSTIAKPSFTTIDQVIMALGEMETNQKASGEPKLLTDPEQYIKDSDDLGQDDVQVSSASSIDAVPTPSSPQSTTPKESQNQNEITKESQNQNKITNDIDSFTFEVEGGLERTESESSSSSYLSSPSSSHPSLASPPNLAVEWKKEKEQLQDQLSDLTSQLADEQSISRNKATELEQMRERNSQLEDEKAQLRQRLQDALDRAEALQCEKDEAKAATEFTAPTSLPPSPALSSSESSPNFTPDVQLHDTPLIQQVFADLGENVIHDNRTSSGHCLSNDGLFNKPTDLVSYANTNGQSCPASVGRNHSFQSVTLHTSRGLIEVIECEHCGLPIDYHDGKASIAVSDEDHVVDLGQKKEDNDDPDSNIKLDANQVISGQERQDHTSQMEEQIRCMRRELGYYRSIADKQVLLRARVFATGRAYYVPAPSSTDASLLSDPDQETKPEKKKKKRKKHNKRRESVVEEI